MNHSIAPMQLLVSIVERGKGGLIMEAYRNYHLFHHIQASGQGTAASHLLDTLGFGTTERDIILTFGPRDSIRGLIRALKDENHPKQNVQGIAFSLSISGMSAVLAVLLSQTREAERRDQVMEEAGSHYSLILVTANQGYTDEVMDTARSAGAWGGTIFRARWTGADEAQKLAGLGLQAEKEVLAIMVHNEERNGVMEAIDRVHGLHSPAQALVVSLPIDRTARLD